MRPWRNLRVQVAAVSVIWLCIVGLLYLYLTKSETKIKDYTREVLWWTDNMQFKYDELRHCGFETCRVTNDRHRLRQARAVLFYGSNMQPHDFPLPRIAKQLWGLLHEESPRNVPFVPYDEFLKHFNFSSTFSRFSDFPLTTQYLPQASDLTQYDYYSGHLNKQRLQFNDGLAPIIFLQSDCNTMSGREDYVRELMNHIRVDSYGSCLHNRDLPENLQKDYLNNLYSPDLLRFLSRYKFMIAIENAVCEDYITEKYWRPIITGVIPIYFGSPSIRLWQPLNKSAIYVDDFANARALAAYLHQIDDNKTEYDAYRGHKLNRRIDNGYLLNNLITRSYSIIGGQVDAEHSLFQKFECFMCIRAVIPHRPHHADRQHYNCPLPPVYAPLELKKEPDYADDWRSMLSVGRCQAQLLDEYFKENRAYKKSEFEARLSRMVEKNMCN